MRVTEFDWYVRFWLGMGLAALVALLPVYVLLYLILKRL